MINSTTDPIGLTLIELLIALALMLTLAGTALPSYGRSLARWRLDAGARQVVVDLGVARLRAIAENTGHRLRFAPEAPGYAHEREASPGEFEVLAPRALPEGVHVLACTARGSTITFRPRGHATTFGTITLGGPDGAERRVIVDIAGRSRIQ